MSKSITLMNITPAGYRAPETKTWNKWKEIQSHKRRRKLLGSFSRINLTNVSRLVLNIQTSNLHLFQSKYLTENKFGLNFQILKFHADNFDSRRLIIFSSETSHLVLTMALMSLRRGQVRRAERKTNT